MKRLGDYELLGELARGGMGAVYRARDPAGREVAVKLIRSDLDDARLEQEAQAAARLNHPVIVTVHAFGRAGSRPYLVMELITGRTLQDDLDAHGPLPLERALAIARQLAAALAHAHAHGVLHRDLKPQNVMLTPEEQVKLTDFGLARVQDRSRHLTRTGELLGTPAYMPPEQATGALERLGPTADVYGLGATLYAMLSGRPPFAGASPVNVLNAVLHKPPLPPSAHRPGLPSALDAVVLRALEKDPARRYPTMAAFDEALTTLRAGAPAPGWPRSRWRALALLTLSALVAGLALAWRAQPASSQVRSTPTASTPSPADDDASERSRLRGLTPSPEALRALDTYLRAHPDADDAGLRRAYVAMARTQPLVRLAPDAELSQMVLATFHGERAAALSDAGTYQRWDARSGGALETRSLGLVGQLTDLAPAAGRVWASIAGKLLPVPDDPALPPVPVPEEFRFGTLALRPDGSRVAVVTQREGVLAFVLELDARTGDHLAEYLCAGTYRFHDLRYAPDGRQLTALASDVQGNRCWLLLWDAPSGEPRRVALPGEAQRLRYAPDGGLLVGSNGGVLAIHDPVSGMQRGAYEAPIPAGDFRAPRAHLGQIRDLVFAPRAPRLYSVAKKGAGAPQHELRVWDTQTRALLEVRPLPHEPVRMELSADGELLLLGTHEGVAEVWLADPLR